MTEVATVQYVCLTGKVIRGYKDCLELEFDNVLTILTASMTATDDIDLNMFDKQIVVGLI